MDSGYSTTANMAIYCLPIWVNIEILAAFCYLYYNLKLF
jgi:hypothetical protein